MTILLIGSTGNGKSTLGNFLLDPSKEHILDNPTFKPGTQNEPKTKHVTAASIGDLTVVDTPGLNESGYEDFKHMTCIVKQLNELQSISACILCIKFEYKICKATMKYYKRLLPQLFENNVFVVFTNYCTDERSVKHRKRLNIDVENALREVSKGLVYRPGYFLIDALPFSAEERSEHEETRSSILSFTRKLKPVYIHKSLKVLKTLAVLEADRKEFEKIQGEIKRYEEAIQIPKGKKEELTRQMTSDQLQLSDAKRRLEKLDSTDLETTEVWDINVEWKWQSKEFMVKSEWPIADFIWWDNGKLAEKQVKMLGKYSISIVIKGEFMTRLQAKLTVQVKKCDKYEEEIKELKEKRVTLTWHLSTKYVETLEDLDKEMLKLQSQVSERNARIKKLQEDSMTVEEAEKRLKKLYM